jgi:hypothetical protein
VGQRGNRKHGDLLLLLLRFTGRNRTVPLFHIPRYCYLDKMSYTAPIPRFSNISYLFCFFVIL